jgi:hypothetical protein
LEGSREATIGCNGQNAEERQQGQQDGRHFP